MKLLASLTYWGLFGLTFPLGYAIAMAGHALTRRSDPTRRWLHRFVCSWIFWHLRRWPGWRFEFSGRENIPQGACVFVANHQSMSDIVVLMGLQTPFKFVSKASLFEVPLIGSMMERLGYVSVERGRPMDAQRAIETCKSWLGQQVPVLIFPEGTWAPTGTLLPFRRGAFLLAMQAGVPVVPITIEGTRTLLPADSVVFGARAHIRVEVHPQIPPSAFGNDSEALAQRVRQFYAARPSVTA